MDSAADAAKSAVDPTTTHGRIIHGAIDAAHAHHRRRRHGRVVDGDLLADDSITRAREAEIRAADDIDAVSADYDALLEQFDNTGNTISIAERKAMIEAQYVPKVEEVEKRREEDDNVKLIQQAHGHALESRNRLFAVF